jgi:hypothetical protein
MFVKWIVVAAASAAVMPGAAETRLRIPIAAFQNTAARAALDRLENSTDEFKGALNQALDKSILDGSVLEGRLNQWANLLEDEIDNSGKEFDRVADSGKHPDAEAMERFADHWGNAMMAATAINRAMIRRGFAPTPERQWIDIRSDLNRVAQAVGRPPLPDMTVVIFRPAPYSVLSHDEVKRTMERLRDASHHFEDKLDHAWFVAMGPAQRHVAERWADDLKSATRQALDEYKDKDASEFQFRIEEALMLAAGLNRAFLVTRASAPPTLEWMELRSELNAIARRFGYPVLAGAPGA